jgi:aminoglycoside 3-N-acetyltransferase I
MHAVPRHPIEVQRLTGADVAVAQVTFDLMAAVFETPSVTASEHYLAELLSSKSFWAFTAQSDGLVVGGLTAFVLPMARTEASELFIYDLAVRPSHQRSGVATLLMETARQAARAEGIDDVFLFAEDEDEDAVAFYNAIAMHPTPVTQFAYGPTAID